MSDRKPVEASTVKWTIGILIALVAAGSGVVGWKQIFSRAEVKPNLPPAETEKADPEITRILDDLHEKNQPPKSP